MQRITRHCKSLYHSNRIFDPNPLSSANNSAAIKNVQPILNVIKDKMHVLQEGNKSINILEIGSGRGYHMNYFADYFKNHNNIMWQPTDYNTDAFHLIQQNITDFDNESIVQKPFLLDLNEMKHRINTPNNTKYDMIFAVNVFHVTSIECWQRFIRHSFYNLCNFDNQNRILLIYGPFNLDGNFTSQSNKEFDAFMRETGNNYDYHLKDITQMNTYANQYSLELRETIEMPANNFCLIFQPMHINVDDDDDDEFETLTL